MRILLANPRGFCAGVNMAIDVVDEVLRRRGPPVYVYHEIVHNRHVVDDFRQRGVIFIDDIDAAPQGAVVVYSAHGISPAVRAAARQRGLTEVDATCPLVTKVHMEVLRYARDGYTIFFVGHRDHDEAVGTVGEAPDAIIVVETPEQAEQVSAPDPGRVAVVTQTTLSVSDAQRIIDVLRRRFPRLRMPERDDICYATTNRQAAVSQLAPEADLVLVVGSRNSSNSQRLVDRAREQGRAAYLIDDASQLQPQWFAQVECVLITAGASAPDHLVQGLIERLKREFGGAEVQTRTLVEEDLSFDLPLSVRRLPVLR
jgi:4-hydroxy-3-methylbut-2-enyl diphosphate reductase